LCHTALVWERTIGGRTLTFRLYGINNQNFIMRDEETGTWWQQVTGEAMHGPLKGKRLTGVHHDEISFAVFKAERPAGRVLKPTKKHADDYEDWNWEKRMRKVRTVYKKGKDEPFEPRTMVVGVKLGGRARAYPFPLLRQASPVVDRLGDEPLLIVLGDDKKSVRVFKTTVDGQALTFAKRAGVRPLRLFDAETGSEWDFSGTAVGGPLLGRKLEKVFALKEYWFDWKTYNPDTGFFGPPMSSSPTETAAEGGGDGEAPAGAAPGGEAAKSDGTASPGATRDPAEPD
jgi:hypothetical protein